jgi:iron complex outermembrane receptor protein
VPSIRETVVVTGGTSPVTFETLGRTVFVIGRDEIERLPAASVADLLRLASSVAVKARGPWGVQTDFAVRGATFGQTLVLLDGVRLNDAQTGHHNGDLPVTLDDIERIEVLLGPGSALFGADAFGGTINIITRAGPAPATARLRGGSFGSAGLRASGTLDHGGITQTGSAEYDRADGFMFARDHRVVTLRGRTDLGRRAALTAAVTDKDFGANGFYGASPSYEWTSQAILAGRAQMWQSERGEIGVRAFYRTHGDRFLWDVRRPGQAENRHRTHAQGVAVTLRHRAGDAAQLTAGVEHGTDWLRSSNLGDHAFWRLAGFAELQQRIGSRVTVSPALRTDYYSSFGPAVNPAVAASVWLGDAVRLRGSVARAFRVPTFTERYYRDPAHEATASLEPERAWASELGADWLPSAQWTVSGAVFQRHERDLIDWVRGTITERWRTTNIRDVRTWGAEAGFRFVGDGRSASLGYTWLTSDADQLPMLSKYALEYARHAITASASAGMPVGLEIGARLDARHPYARDAYLLVDVRLSRRFGLVSLFVEGVNLLDASYEEVAGVSMPGRAGFVGLGWRAR